MSLRGEATKARVLTYTITRQPPADTGLHRWLAIALAGLCHRGPHEEDADVALWVFLHAYLMFQVSIRASASTHSTKRPKSRGGSFRRQKRLGNAH